jgi:hypothetical protein
VNPCSDIKPKGVDLEDSQKRITNVGDKIRSFFPTIFFGVFLGAAWFARAFATDSVSSIANLFVLFLATIASLIALNQRLPLQNVIVLTVVIALFSGTALLTASALKVSIVPPVANKNFSHLPAWTAPLLWTIALVNARGIAKLLLHPLRKINNYGLVLIALSSLLVASLNLCSEFSGKVFMGQFAIALAGLVATTPWFIDKKRVEHAPDFQPLAITILLMFW